MKLYDFFDEILTCSYMERVVPLLQEYITKINLMSWESAKIKKSPKLHITIKRVQFNLSKISNYVGMRIRPLKKYLLGLNNDTNVKLMDVIPVSLLQA